MTEQNHQPPAGDAFDRAAAAVRGQAIPAPPADLAAAVAAAVSNRLQLAEARAWRRRWIVRGMSVGGLAACLAVAVTWGGPAYALDPVIRKMKAAESARFTVVQTLGEQKPLSQKYWVRGDRMRVEFADAATVIVTDYKQRKGLLLNPPARMFHRLPRPGAEIAVGDSKTPLDQFLAIRDAKPERLGKEAVGGVLADKLKVVRPAKPDTGEMASEWTVWLDPATTLPVKMVSTGRVVAGDPKLKADGMFVAKEVAAESVFTDFAWNEKFPDTLFILDPPDSYTEGGPGRPKPEKTQPVSLRRAAELLAVAPAVTYRHAQRHSRFHTIIRDVAVRGRLVRTATRDLDVPTDDQSPVRNVEVYDYATNRGQDVDHKYRTFQNFVGIERRFHPIDALTEEWRAATHGEGEADTVDGRHARVVRHGRQTVYLDADTCLPLLVVWLRRQGVVDVLDGFDYPAALPAERFTLTAPAGYEREGQKLPAPAKK